MNKRIRRVILGCVILLSSLLIPALSPSADASTAWGSINNFDAVNDTSNVCHGFEIEIDGIHSKDISYTYDWNHYGVPKITEDNTDPLLSKVFVRYESAKNPDGTWVAFTSVPAGPISPTDGHQFTNPSVNFGGEHFGVGFFGVPAAVKYSWLKDDGTGHLIFAGAVNIATPTFNYYQPAGAPAQVVAAIVPPPPPPPQPEDPPVLQFGPAMWVKDTKTTSHNTNKVELRDLVSDDPNDPNDRNWKNGEDAEVETEWRLLQTEFAAADGGANGELAGAAEDLPGGDEVVTRRYDFYKYVGPIDAETGEAMADQVGPDGTNGVGSVTYADYYDLAAGEWHMVTTDLSSIPVVGDYIGAQMAGFDPGAQIGLIDHLQDGEINVPYVERTIVIGGTPPIVTTRTDPLPAGMTFDEVTGVLSGTPTVSGTFTFTVHSTDAAGGDVSKTYSLMINAGGVLPPPHINVTVTASPAEGGIADGTGEYVIGTTVTVQAFANPGFAFVSWTDGGTVVSSSLIYEFTADVNRGLVAVFVPTYSITTSASPTAGGSTSGDATYNSGDGVTVTATANPGYNFVNWTEGATIVSSSASYFFNASADRNLVANFVPTYTIITSAAPSVGGSTSGDGIYNSGDNVTVHATPSLGYDFVNWTEGGTIVSSLANYPFTASADRTLVANFLPLPPVLSISSATATRNSSNVDVTVVILNSGGPAQAVTIGTKKEATIDGKATNERPPVVLGNIDPGGTATTVLTFTGVKAGTRTLQVRLTYTGGTATLSVPVVVP